MKAGASDIEASIKCYRSIFLIRTRTDSELKVTKNSQA